MTTPQTRRATRSTRAQRHTTRPAAGGPAGGPAAPIVPAKPPGPTVYSGESGRTYHLEKLIGKGGFGEVYLATATPSHSMPARVCVKLSDRLAGWLREAYFADLLEQLSDNAGDLLIPPELKVAQAHAELGDPRRAFEWEQRACTAAPGRRRWFRSCPELGSLDPFRRRAAAALQGRSRPEP
jgi:serine/threonine protein kinase